jgi:hypothetical protein
LVQYEVSERNLCLISDIGLAWNTVKVIGVGVTAAAAVVAALLAAAVGMAQQ